MILAAILDDHPALRAGLETVLRREPGIKVVGAVASLDELLSLLSHSKPDVVLLDYHLPGYDGLLACRQIKRSPLAPRVLIYSAYAGSSLALPALLAGADGVLGKGVPAAELYDALRRIARGERIGAPVASELIEQAIARLDEDDLPIFDMALQQTSERDISRRTGVEAAGVSERLDRIIRRLRVEVPEIRL